MTSAMNQKTKAGPVGPTSFWAEVDGCYIPKIFETNRSMKEQVQCLKSLDMRPDDIMVLAFPKSGTHWIWEITSMLLAGKASYETRSKVMAMMEASEIENIKSQPSPRILNCHLPLHLLNQRQIKEKKVKIIHVYRNPKDVLVSGYFHFQQLPGWEASTLEETLHSIFTDGVPGHKYFEYMQEMDEWHKANPEVPFFLTSYEETKQDPEAVMRKLAEFLGVRASPQLVKDIAEATSLQKMKEADKRKAHSSMSMDLKIYRKGQVGDWKNHLTVAQSEHLDKEMKVLKSCDYHFRYTL